MKIRSEITLKTQRIHYFEKKTLNVSNIKQHTSVSMDLETLKNLNGLGMEESVYSGADTKF